MAKTYPPTWTTRQVAFFAGLMSAHIGIGELKNIVELSRLHVQSVVFFRSGDTPGAAHLARSVEWVRGKLPAHFWEGVMRSELVTQAVGPVRNRFLLVHVASVLTRKFHRPTKDRMPDSINSSLAGLGEGKYLLKHFVRPDLSTAGVEVYDPNSTGQLKPEDALLALTTFTTGLPYFPPQPVHFNAGEVWAADEDGNQVLIAVSA